MCGRYAASRNPDDLVEEFELVEKPEQALAPSYNVAPTQDVYAVVERAPREEPEAPPARQLRVVRWGLVPSWAKDPKIGNRMINARMETVAEKPAYKRAFAKRRCLLPADGYFEWYGEKGHKQPFFMQPKDGGVMAMAGLYELWKDKDAPEGTDPWLWTCTVLTTTAPDDLGRIHDRMPLLVEPERYGAWLDPGNDDPDELAGLLVPAAPGPAARLPGVHRRQQRAQQPARPGRPPAGRGRARRRAGGALLTEIETPVGVARVHVAAAARPRATLVLGHGAGGGVDTPDLRALARCAAVRGGHRRAGGAALAGRRAQGGRAAADAGPGVAGRRAGARRARRCWSWRPLGRCAGGLPHRRRPSGPTGCLALAFPLHPPGTSPRAGSGSSPDAGVPTLVVQGGRDPFGPAAAFPAGLPAGTEVRAVPHADHSFRVAKAAPLTSQEAVGLVVDHTRRWLRGLLGRDS